MGYFTAPDFLFDTDLSRNAKLVFLYFCRRANTEGLSFPSLKRICRDCGIKSRTTVIKAIKELEVKDFITKIKSNRINSVNNYVIGDEILRIINKEYLYDNVQNMYSGCS